MTRSKRIYVLDTNVLMHDPTALFKFEEHDVFIPMMVLEELDNGKKGHSEASRNARQVSRFLNELIEIFTVECRLFKSHGFINRCIGGISSMKRRVNIFSVLHGLIAIVNFAQSIRIRS